MGVHGFRWIVVGAAALALGGLAGCGDDDGGGDALTEAEFLEQGNAICDAGNERLDATFADFSAEPTEEEMADAAEIVADDIEGQIDDVDELVPPDDLAGAVDEALAQARDDLAEFRDAGTAVFEGDDPFVDSAALLDAVGLTSCASDD